MDMNRYSRRRPIPTITRSLVVRKKKGNKEQDIAKIGEKGGGDSGLQGGASELEGRAGGTAGPGRRNRGAARLFAKGPIYLDQAVRAANKGGSAVVVWLAVRARLGSACGAPADTAWIAEATGLNDRTIRKAVAALVSIGMLKREGDKISTPSYAEER
jgi:hypothetical protein